MKTETDAKLVVDASAVSAIFFREPEAELLERKLLNRSWVAPTLIDYEIGSVYLKKIKYHPQLRQQLDECYQVYCDAAIERVDVPVSSVFAIAEKYGLTIYDASYFWLAATLNLKLVTLDKQLAAAWAKK
ncbi:type II toxin-antitoxin system VapC family toxin [Bdellovibrionota bacterium FG-2]